METPNKLVETKRDIEKARRISSTLVTDFFNYEVLRGIMFFGPHFPKEKTDEIITGLIKVGVHLIEHARNSEEFNLHGSYESTESYYRRSSSQFFHDCTHVLAAWKIKKSTVPTFFGGRKYYFTNEAKAEELTSFVVGQNVQEFIDTIKEIPELS